MSNTPLPTILIVEDERIVAKDLQQTLNGLGYDAYAIAVSAEEAISFASKRCPNLALMDIRIKGQLNGIVTAQLLRQRFGVGVIYLTAHADDATLERAKQTAPYGYLLKPVKAAELKTTIDVALHKLGTEKIIRERDRIYTTTLSSLHDAVIAVDLSGKITFMNTAAESLAGASAEEAIGRSIHDVLSAQDVTIPELPQATTYISAADPTTQSTQQTAVPVIDQGKLTGAVMVFHHKTAAGTVESQQQAKATLSDRFESLSTLASGVAHEVNNPLAVVVANTQFISDQVDELSALLNAKRSSIDGDTMQQIQHYLTEIAAVLKESYAAANRINQVVSNLWSFARPNATLTQRTDIHRIIHSVVASCRQDLDQHATLALDLKAVPSIQAPDIQLYEVLYNIVTNAIQAIAPGNPAQNKIHITCYTTSAGQVAIEVKDSGCGIDAPNIPKLFEPFFTTRAAAGAKGLGLSVCYGIVTSLNGKIEVESIPQTGTLIRVLLEPISKKSTN